MLQKMIDDLIQQVCAQIKNDFAQMSNKEKLEFRKTLLDAYNTYQDGVRDGVDYIFDVRNKQDVARCDMTFSQWYELANDFVMEVNEMPYFFCGVNYKEPKAFTHEALFVEHLFSWLYEMVRDILYNPSCCESYKKIYDKYISKNCYV